jgi:hypothetical protein
MRSIISASLAFSSNRAAAKGATGCRNEAEPICPDYLIDNALAASDGLYPSPWVKRNWRKE